MRFATVLSLLAAASAAVAKPLNDVHATSLELYSVNALEDGGRFAVTVSREDDLVEKGDVVATRFTDIIMMFDVTPKGDVTVNGQLIPMGLTNVQVEAGTIVGTTPAGANLTRDQLESAFDIGVVGIQVLAASEHLVIDNQNVTRITIAERVYELNGQEVVQSAADDSVVGQIVDVYANGTMVRQKACPMMVGEKLMPSPYGRRRGCLRRFARWFNALPAQSKAFVVVVFGTAFLSFYAMLGGLAYHLVRARREAAAQAEPFVFEDRSDGKPGVLEVEYEKVKVVYEMPPAGRPSEEEEALPAYGGQQGGYAAVPTSEPKI
ncbi:hypothetical protein HDU96_007452 [Phlyctochytrium bullatum]|nr:hypothetical protein HDU96_007452 [Phlyctochytrium bullatum]